MRGETALVHAADHDNMQMLELMLQYGDKFSMGVPSYYYRNLLHHCKSAHCLQLVLKQDGGNLFINAVGERGYTPIAVAG